MPPMQDLGMLKVNADDAAKMSRRGGGGGGICGDVLGSIASTRGPVKLWDVASIGDASAVRRIGAHAGAAAAREPAGDVMKLAGIATKNGHLAALQAIADIAGPMCMYDPLSEAGESVVHVACRHGHIHILDYLATLRDPPADFTSADYNGRTPARDASASGRSEVLLWLHRHGQDISGQSCRLSSTLAHEAASRGHPHVLRLCKELGAETAGPLDALDDDGRCPLDLVINASQRGANAASYAECERVLSGRDTCGSLPEAVARVSGMLLRREIEIFPRPAGGDTGEHLLRHSVLGGVPDAAKLAALAYFTCDKGVARAAGALLGVAAGDALGAPVEFVDVVDYDGSDAAKAFDIKTGRYGGTPANQFRLKPGQWTDDTSMALCVADSLLVCGCYDGADVRQRFYAWFFGAYNTPFANDPKRTWREGMPQDPQDPEEFYFFHRGAIGCGGNMAKNLDALAECSVGQRPPARYEAYDGQEDAGNAPLLRVAALPIFLRSRPLEEMLAAARESSYATHPGAVAAECCAFLAFTVREALLRRADSGEGALTMRAFLDGAATAYALRLDGDLADAGLSLPDRSARELLRRLLRSPSAAPPPSDAAWQSLELAWSWRVERTMWRRTLANRGERYNGHPVSAVYVGSYAPDGLAVALWACYHAASLDAALERAVGLCGDADSNGAIAGVLAGAFYGIQDLSPRVAAEIQRWDGGGDIALRGVLLWYLGETGGDIHV